MFWVFDGDELQPRSVLDGALGEEEFLECSLEDSSELMVPDFWRMSPAGMATIVRSYREDRRHPVSTRSRMAAAAWAEASRFSGAARSASPSRYRSLRVRNRSCFSTRKRGTPRHGLLLEGRQPHASARLNILTRMSAARLAMALSADMVSVGVSGYMEQWVAELTSPNLRTAPKRASLTFGLTAKSTSRTRFNPIWA
ncbi:MAG: hypothetical protein OXC93_12935 [Rhodospirillaceae bacterium]|nr:hypothetical protein [Rhodospirillaceae bacterium]